MRKLCVNYLKLCHECIRYDYIDYQKKENVRKILNKENDDIKVQKI